MNVLDVLLLVAAVWFAIVGYRQGFVVGVLSVIGFLGGGLAAVYLLPLVWRPLAGDAELSTTAAIVAVAVVLVFASVGQTLTTHLGNRLRRHITWSPARALDATGGALVNVVAMLLVAWLLGTLLAGTALPFAKQVRDSQVYRGVSQVMPDQPPRCSPTSARSSRRTASRRSSTPSRRSRSGGPPAGPGARRQPGRRAPSGPS